MILWRISEHLSLGGEGGIAAAGRWHSQGRPIIYTAESSTLAMLEVMVHLELDPFPASFQLMKLEVPDELSFRTWTPKRNLSQRGWGDAWLSACETLLAKVPSVVAPEAFNWLINPAHPEARRIKIAGISRWPWDRRLFR